MYERCVPISSSALAKLYLYPDDAIHCFYCGNHPGKGRVRYDFSVIPGGKVCCTIRPLVNNPQGVLHITYDVAIDSSSLSSSWLARSTGQAHALQERSRPQGDRLRSGMRGGQSGQTVQSDLRRFCGQ